MFVEGALKQFVSGWLFNFLFFVYFLAFALIWGLIIPDVLAVKLALVGIGKFGRLLTLG